MIAWCFKISFIKTCNTSVIIKECLKVALLQTWTLMFWYSFLWNCTAELLESFASKTCSPALWIIALVFTGFAYSICAPCSSLCRNPSNSLTQPMIVHSRLQTTLWHMSWSCQAQLHVRHVITYIPHTHTRNRTHAGLVRECDSSRKM